MVEKRLLVGMSFYAVEMERFTKRAIPVRPRDVDVREKGGSADIHYSDDINESHACGAVGQGWSFSKGYFDHRDKSYPMSIRDAGSL